MRIKTFLIEPSELVQFAVVRVSRERKCRMHATWNCYARWVAFEGNESDDRIAHLRGTILGNAALWPGTCDRCGEAFTPQDLVSTGENAVWTNAERTWFGLLADAPPGAMWWATWLDEYLHHQLEHVLVVKTPAGDWTPDDRASNCTKPDDKEHFCWVLHGPLETVTVDKNGNTCGAGAGSIQYPEYHGFLTGGHLIRC